MKRVPGQQPCPLQTHPPTHLPDLPRAQFLPVLMRPNGKQVARLRKLLAQNFGGVGQEHFTTEGGAGEELFPYVSFTLGIE